MSLSSLAIDCLCPRHVCCCLQVVPVTIDQYSLEGYYSCPVYTNMQRANVYSPIVSQFTMKTDEPSYKWVLASVAVLLQDELA